MLGLSALQIILALLSGAIIVQAFLKFLKREQSQTFFKLFNTLFIWGGIFAFTLSPDLSHSVTRALGFGENLNTLIFLGFVVIFLVITKILRVIERIERNISEIVRKEALSIIEKKKDE